MIASADDSRRTPCRPPYPAAPLRIPADTPDLAARAAPALLAWYDRHRRTLPWRAPPGGRSDPYRVWVSEVMLQQTTVATVARAFAGFLARYPTVEAMAAAPLDDVLHAWQGFGYYARARNMHRAARRVAALGGAFPDTEEGLRALPGVGAYIAAAVAAIAFDRPATVVDANVERVVARLFAVREALPGARPAIRRHAAALTPPERAGDHAQAMMDLGATICTPRAPRCLLCPLATFCRARAAGIAATLPAKAAKAARPLRHGVAFWAVRPDGAVLLRRRPEDGLLGGMMEVPTTEFRERPWTAAEVRAAAPVAIAWHPLGGTVRHGFTHFSLELTVMAGRVPVRARPSGVWSTVEALGDHALPTLMKKVVRHALGNVPGAGKS
ncbi:MAG: A/G-specific adenine glycosylase [Alphaproteobacteria bacterium]|nr:A/G-specific adenine glycosylase [Alphaproteobacteria bacterium]